MDKFKQDRLIAEFCGWTICEDDLPIAPNGYQDVPPYYSEDLNAMREAEECLSNQQMSKYLSILACEILPMRSDNRLHDVLPMHSSAAQRAEAFLKTIKKWEE